VWITADTDATLTFLPASGLRLRDLASGATWTPPTGSTYTQWRITRSGTSSLLHYRKADGTWVARTPPLAKTALWLVENPGTGVVKVLMPGSRTRELRGQVSLTPYGSTARTVNRLAMEDYLRGVVPAEMPTSWATHAVRAQAVAARSYAARLRSAASASAGYDLCDTTACQLYRGAAETVAGRRTSFETTDGNAAISATVGQVVMSGTSVALTQFSSSNGGHTTRGDYAYLVAKPDPYDGVTRNQTWSVPLTSATIQRAYPSIGTLRSVQVTSRDGAGRWGGRVSRVTLAGSTTSVSISGDTFRSVFGLRSTLFNVTGGLATSGVSYQRWQAEGGVTGWLGAPTASERAVAGGQEARFEVGDLMWSSATGTRAVRGGIRTAYRRLGGATSVLGFPTTEETAGPVTGSYQSLFSRGGIYWSSATGAHELHGAISTYYRSASDAASRLGLPTSATARWTARARTRSSAAGSTGPRPPVPARSAARRTPRTGCWARSRRSSACPPRASTRRPPGRPWTSRAAASPARRPARVRSATAEPTQGVVRSSICPQPRLRTPRSPRRSRRVGSMPRAELNLSRPPDDLPEARVWRPDLLAAADDRRPGQPVQPALFPLPTRSTSGRGAFTDLVDLGTLESSARRGRRARGTVVVTVVGPAPGPHLPDVRRWSVSLGVALIEVLLGYRPLAQLLRWLNDDALRVLGVAASGIRDRSAGPGLRERITVVSARVQILGPGRVEVCLHATRSGDRLVVAFRLVDERDRWLCIELDLLGPRVRGRRLVD